MEKWDLHLILFPNRPWALLLLVAGGQRRPLQSNVDGCFPLKLIKYDAARGRCCCCRQRRERVGTVRKGDTDGKPLCSCESLAQRLAHNLHHTSSDGILNSPGGKEKLAKPCYTLNRSERAALKTKVLPVKGAYCCYIKALVTP